MNKGRRFENTIFPVEVIARARERVRQAYKAEDEEEAYAETETFQVIRGDTSIADDTFQEWAAEYRAGFDHASLSVGSAVKHKLVLSVQVSNTSVDAYAPRREEVDAVLGLFADAAPAAHVPPKTLPAAEPVVFIGHGHSNAWRDLADHLRDQHGYDIQAYEVGARAGHTIRDILDDLLEQASFAVLVMTAEDEDAAGRLHPRLNVVHELGLFQGRLGFSRAIVLLEEGTEEFSNIHGIHQVRFARGRIRETFGDVLATLRREFTVPVKPRR